MNLNSERSALWKALKGAGWTPEQGRTFVKYSRDDLVQELQGFQEATGQIIDVIIEEEAPAETPAPEAPEIDPEAAAFFGVQLPTPEAPAPAEKAPAKPEPPRSNQAPENTLPGQHTLTQGDSIVLRVDDEGREWFQEEVRKPAYPKPRGRRILRYLDKGVQTETVVAGEYVESYEVEGSGPGRAAEIKITLPSYQVGIYKDPRFPFKIHTYNGNVGFNLHEVEEFYGGTEMVPEDVKRIYVENDLCYDVRSVIRAIQTEHRQMQLQGRTTQ